MAFTERAGFIVVVCVVFSLAFAFFFLQGKSDAVKKFAHAQHEMESVFSDYGVLAGAVFGMLTLVVLLILHGVLSVFGLSRFSFATPVLCLAAFTCWFVFGVQIVFFEPLYTNIAKAIIFFIGWPLLYSSGLAVLISFASLFIGRRTHG